MGRLSVGASSRFAVYCGNGVYVGALGLDAEKSVHLHVCAVDSALIASRKRAIEVLHAVRRMGVAAWIVPAGAAA